MNNLNIFYFNQPAPAVYTNPSLNSTRKSWCNMIYIVLLSVKSPPEFGSVISSIGLDSVVSIPDLTVLSDGSDKRSNPYIAYPLHLSSWNIPIYP